MIEVTSANREAAIVSPFPGTTRDVVEVTFGLGGYPVTCGDTAGIHVSSDVIETEGIRRAHERYRTSSQSQLEDFAQLI